MLKTAQCREPPTDTRASPATVVPIPVCSGCRAAEARMRRLASSTWATTSRTWTTGRVGELDDGLGGDPARDLARGMPAHAVGDDVDGARSCSAASSLCCADASHVGGDTPRPTVMRTAVAPLAHRLAPRGDTDRRQHLTDELVVGHGVRRHRRRRSAGRGARRTSGASERDEVEEVGLQDGLDVGVRPRRVAPDELRTPEVGGIRLGDGAAPRGRPGRRSARASPRPGRRARTARW